MNDELHKWVDTKQGANVVTLLARHGKIVSHDAYGVLDASASTKVPAKKDTIFRIMSMTKPVVGVAMMMMYEAGHWAPDDLVSKHIPEFADLKVKGVPQKTPMTMRMLCSHSAGFGMMITVNSPTLATIISPLVKSGLSFQPGTDWKYGPAAEIQGYLIQRWSGMDLADFLEEKLFKPLGMPDTGFFIDKSKVDRVSKLHAARKGSVTSMKTSVATEKPKRISPSGGLLSTAEDYFKFAQMVLNNGTFDGKTYLKPASIALMHANVLAPNIPVKFGGGSGEGIGFGVDFAIVLDKVKSHNNMPVGSYYWGGAYGTWFWNDPVNDVVFVGLIQNIGVELSGDGTLRQVSAKGLYAALTEK